MSHSSSTIQAVRTNLIVTSTQLANYRQSNIETTYSHPGIIWSPVIIHQGLDEQLYSRVTIPPPYQ